MMGLSTSGSISLGWALVAGRNRVPSPAAGNTALRTCFFMGPLGWNEKLTYHATACCSPANCASNDFSRANTCSGCFSFSVNFSTPAGVNWLPGSPATKRAKRSGSTEAVSVKRMLTASRRRSICATPIRCDSRQLPPRLHAGDALVHTQPLVLFWDVVGRNTDVQPQVQLRFGRLLLHLALQIAHRALQHGGVKLETDGFNVSALLAAQQVSGAA